MDRTSQTIRLVSSGFPRSGNTFLGQLLEQSFPDVDVVEFTHNTNTLDIAGCIVPLRNPYKSVPSWCTFSGEQDLEATARWYMRFNTKVLNNINNLFVVDFVELSTNPLTVVNKISNQFNLFYTQIDYSNIDKNTSQRKYQNYDSLLMKDCYDLYKEILNQKYNN